MIELVNFRKHFGLSQSNIAAYLGISVSTIKMVETGRRMLTGIAAAKCAHLLQYSYTTPVRLQQNITETNEKDSQIAGGELNRYIKSTTKLLRQLKQQLTTMQATYQLALHRQHLLHQMRQNIVSIGVDIIWLEVLTAATNRELAQNGPKAQRVLLWKIDTNNYGVQKALALEQAFASINGS